jgi:hypothetical protein
MRFSHQGNLKMVEVHLVFVPADGAAVDCKMTVELPAAPEVGDSILVRRPPESGYESFIVKRRWWRVETAADANAVTSVVPASCVLGSDPKPCPTAAGLVVECHFARCDNMTKEHGVKCEHYAARGTPIANLAEMPF